MKYVGEHLLVQFYENATFGYVEVLDENLVQLSEISSAFSLAGRTDQLYGIPS